MRTHPSFPLSDRTTREGNIQNQDRLSPIRAQRRADDKERS